MESGPRRYHNRRLAYTRSNRLIFRFRTIRMDSNWMEIFITILYIYCIERMINNFNYSKRFMDSRLKEYLAGAKFRRLKQNQRIERILFSNKYIH